MPKLIRVFDPDETERRITMEVSEANCPDLLSFLSEMPYRTETPLIRGVFYQWFLQHKEAGTLDAAVDVALHGLGGLIEDARPAEPVKRGRPSKARRPRTVTPRVVAAPRSHAPAQPTQQEPLQRAAITAPPDNKYQEDQPINRNEAVAPTVNQPLAPPATIASQPVAPATGQPPRAAEPALVQLPTVIDADALAALDGMDTMFAA